MSNTDSPAPPRHDTDDRVISLAARRRKTVACACPICGRSAREETRPFCSARCKDVDLARWLNGTYRIPTNEEPDPGAPPPEDSGFD